MFQTFIITLREGVEAALVIAIAVAYLRKAGREALLGTVYRAFAAAFVASLAAGWALTRLQIGEEAFSGWTLLASAGFVLGMVLWMNRHARGVKGEIETRLQQEVLTPAARWGIFLFVFLMVLREGIETVLLLAAIRFDSSGILDVLALVLGLGLAVLFGVSFVRGSIRINLRSFFKVTTVILLVVVAQLVLTGLHELSEAQILPGGPREMALIGPIVRNDVFFLVTILALAAVMLLMEWRGRRAPRFNDLQGAVLRKAVWSARRERFWMLASCSAATLFILTLTAEFIYARSAAELSPAVPLEAVQGQVRIPVATVNDGELHRFAVQADGVSLRMIVIRRPDQSLATALDACELCGNQGYRQSGLNVVCKNCSSAIFIPSIGVRGGCNPVPLTSRVEGDQLIVESRDLVPGGRYFRAESH